MDVGEKSKVRLVRRYRAGASSDAIFGLEVHGREPATGHY